MPAVQDILNRVKKLGVGFITLIVASITALIFFVALFLFFKEKDISILYSQLDENDQAVIVNKLNENNIYYEIDSQKKAINVNKADLLKTRAMLAKHGLPSGGNIVGYEAYDKEEALGTTSAIQHVKFIRALQGELTRTIKSFDKVINARVHLVLPQREIFSQEKQPATASVMLYVRNGAKLDKDTIQAIAHFISSAVPSLPQKNITIVDSKGTPLHLNNNEFLPNIGFSKEIEQIAECENRIKYNLEALIGKIVGIQNVAVKVNVNMNFDAVKTSSEVYDPDKIAIKEEHIKGKEEVSQKENTQNLDTSVANNVPDSETEENVSDTDFTRLDEKEKTYHYAISRTIEDKIYQVGKINRICIAAIINDRFDPITSTYIPREEGELEKIQDLIKAAIGYEERRDDQVVVQSMQFFSHDSNFDDEKDLIANVWWKKNLYNLIKTFVISSFALLAFLYLVRTLSKILVGGEVKQKTNQNLEERQSIVQDESTTKLKRTDEDRLKELLANNKERFVLSLRDLINS
jgi:flagellar M-ring protein FliF